MREFDDDEILNLTKLKDATNKLIEIKLDENEIQAAHALLKKNVMFYLTSNIHFHTLKSPRSCYLTLRVDHLNDNITETVEKILRCVAPPYRIFIDFFCLSQSSTQPDYQLIHPSISTSFNAQTLIAKLKDKEKLLNYALFLVFGA